MPTFEIIMPLAGHVVRNIEAESEDEALDKFFESTDLVIDDDKSNIDHIEFEFMTKIVKGNVCYASPSRMEITKIED